MLCLAAHGRFYHWNAEKHIHSGGFARARARSSATVFGVGTALLSELGSDWSKRYSISMPHWLSHLAIWPILANWGAEKIQRPFLGKFFPAP